MNLLRRGAWCIVVAGLATAAFASPDPSTVSIALRHGGKAPVKSKSRANKARHGTLRAARTPGITAITVVSGAIAPKAIEIENGVSGSATIIGTNLYPKVQNGTDPVLALPQFANDALATFLGFGNSALANTPLLNVESTTMVDWVKDTLVNNDPVSVVGSVATGISPGVSGTLYNNVKRGHWNGARIIDGIAGAEQDQFVKGGKEDDTSTWTIGSGSIGSSKYDATQAYIANTTFPTSDTVNFPTGKKSVLYFGMERRGNNGTTAFDFEFNQKPPISDYVPNRSENDVLFTFEMNGSATSGSATPHVYIYHNGNYLSNEVLAASLPAPRRPVSNINQKETPSAPWGFVNDKGNWEIGQIPVFSVAEAAVPFGVDFLKSINGCGGLAYVQVRTRSSVTNTSDLKDTTKIFAYSFGGPTADLQLQSNCGQTFDYSAAGSHDANGGSNLTYNWTFGVPAGVTLTSNDPELGVDPSNSSQYMATFTSDTVRNIKVNLPVGVDYADITAKLKVVEGAGCDASTNTYTVRVYRALDGTASMSAPCSSNYTINYSSTATGGNAPLSYSWTFYKKGTPDVQVGTSTTASGSFNASSKGDYYGVLTIKDTAATSSDSHVIAKGQCSVAKTTSTVTTYDPLDAAPTLAAPCSSTYDINFDAHASGGNAPLSYEWTFYKKGTPDTSVGTKTTATGTFSAPSAGEYYAILVVKDTADQASGKAVCSVQKTTASVKTYDPLAATPTINAPCSATYEITYSVTASGGNPSLSYEWTFYKKGTPDTAVGTKTDASGTFTAPGKGDYYAILVIKDTADQASGKGQCSLQKTTSTVTTYDPLSITATLAGACDNRTLTYSSTLSGGSGSPVYEWKIYKKGTPDLLVATKTDDHGTYTPPDDGDYYATLKVTDSRSCSDSKTTDTITVAGPMNPAASKLSADGSAMTVTLSVTYHAPATVQWQKFVGGVWVNVSGGTADTLTYSGFEADVTPTSIAFTVGGSSYVGKLYTMKFRAITSRTLNGGCSATSNEVTVTKVVAVDP